MRARGGAEPVPTPAPRPAETAGFSRMGGEFPRDTDCLLEGDGFELSVSGQRISVYRLIRSVACEG
jgi:hypothetical protein